MALFREILSVLMVSIWAGVAVGLATNSLNATASGSANSIIPSKLEAFKASLAANSGDMSARCQEGIVSLAMQNPIVKCINLLEMGPIRYSNEGVAKHINTWIDGVCSATACTSALLKNATQTLANNCKVEIKKQARDTMSIYSLFTKYSILRKEACPNKDKFNVCDTSLVGQQTKLEKINRPFFSVRKAAYCLECSGKKAAIQSSSKTQNGTICSATPDPKKSSTSAADESIVVSLPSSKSAVKPKASKPS